LMECLVVPSGIASFVPSVERSAVWFVAALTADPR
jgi:hypothetical protein